MISHECRRRCLARQFQRGAGRGFGASTATVSTAAAARAAAAAAAKTYGCSPFVVGNRNV